MKTKVVIALLAAGALLLVVWTLRVGSAPESAEPTLPESAGEESHTGEVAAPSLAALEDEGERQSESRTSAGTTDPGVRTPIAGAAAAAGQAPFDAPIRGRVLDSDGRPVAGAGIFLGSFGSNRARGIRLQSSSLFGVRGLQTRITRFGAGDGGATAQDAKPPPRIGASGDQGRFEIARPPDGSVLHARGESHVPVLALDWWGRDPTYVEPILVVARPAAVAGVVVDEAGRPIEGAEIAVRIPDSLKPSLGVILDRAEPLEYFARSGPDGRFEIADAPGVAGRHLVLTRAGSPSQDVPIAAGPETQLRIVLQLAPEPEDAVRGIVLDAESRPVPDASVRLVRHNTRTGTDGKFVLDAADAQPGSEILAAKPGFTPGRAVFDPHAESITLRLGPPTLRLRGRVVDDAGRPMRSVEVRALGLTRVGGSALEDLATWDGPGPFTVGDTDGEGKFEIGGLQPRAYVLGLLDRGTLRTMRTEPIQAGRTDLEIRFQADGASVIVAGRVVDRAGAAVPRAEVRLVRDITREEGGHREGVDTFKSADEEGVFEFQDAAQDVRAARVGFPGDMAFEHPLEAGQDLAHLVLVAYRRAHFQIDLAGSEVQADFFGIQDGAGRGMPIVKYEGNIAKSNMRWPIQDGRSDTLTVLDAAETVILFHQGAEIGRTPLRLVPGELTVVRP